MTISSNATFRQVINNLASAERAIETVRRNAQAPVYQPWNIGTITGGSVKLSALNGRQQYLVNDGAHTLIAPEQNCNIDILYTNGANSGTVTLSGFTHSVGSFTHTLGQNFLCKVTKINSVSFIEILAMYP